MKNYIHLVEELSFNAWPAYKTELYDRWLLRFSYNYTHRTNCINVIGPSTIPIDEKISYCESIYQSFHSPTIFKISPTLSFPLDDILDKKGYHIKHITDTFTMPLVNYHPFTEATQPVTILDHLTQEWIDNLFRLNNTTNETHIHIVPKMYETIPKTTIPAYIKKDNHVVATGLGILDRDHIGIYAIYVDPAYRNQHLAKTICTAIINEAIRKGASKAYLQVVKDNTIAKHVYHSLGFEDLYTYWFRCK